MTFLDKAQSMQFTSPMDKASAETFTMAMILEKQTGRKLLSDTIEDDEKSVVMNIILKRIKGFNLPVGFTVPGLVALECLAGGNIGKAVTILIDCLNHFEGRTDISLGDLTDIYPYGFYNKEVFNDYVDNHLKTRKIRWSEIY